MSIAYNKLKCIEICVEKYEVTNHLNHIFKILIFWYWLLDSSYTVYANSIFLCSLPEHDMVFLQIPQILQCLCKWADLLLPFANQVTEWRLFSVQVPRRKESDPTEEHLNREAEKLSEESVSLSQN